MRLIAALLLLWCSPSVVNATHIIGGELFYTSLDNDDYEVTLKLYRDCGPGNTNQTGFDASAEIGVYDANGNYLSSSFFNLGTITTVPVVLSNPCLTPPASICVEEALYSGTIQLPGGTGGYTLVFQRCCRSPVVINLSVPEDQGITCTVTVPDVNVTGPNSSPSFTAYPPIALCAQQPMTFSNAASDADGDVLVYDLCEPFSGGSPFDPLPSPPSGPPFDPVIWAPGYSQSNMIDAAPPLAIDANTGQVTLTPTLIASFAVGVRVREFRDGVQLSAVIRDFRFDVTACAQTVTSIIADQSANTLCSGLTLDFENNSANSDFYHWDFGVPGTAADTSNEVEPTFTFPQGGSYTVQLIANPGWPCADTSTNTFDVAPPVSVQFAPPPITCFDQQPLALTATGSFSPAADVVWTFTNGAAPDPDQHTSHPTFNDNGTFAVQVTATEFNCSGTYTDSITLHPRPVPAFTCDTAGCTPLDAQFTNNSSAWTPMTYAWSFGDGSASTEEEPMHQYNGAGAFDVSLSVTTTTGCIATETLYRPELIRLWPQPIARFAVDPPVTDLMQPVIEVTDLSTNAYDVTFTMNGLQFDTTSFIYTFDEAGWYTITLISVSGLGCSDSTSMPVFVGGHFFFAPTAFSPDGDGVNEVWLPSVRGARKYRLDVFDRWGTNVFSTTDTKQGWDARDYPIGIYAYKAWLTEWGPLEKEYNGSFTLVR